MEKVIEERIGRADQALRKAREFAECIKRVFHNIDLVILFGSYARGDFNEWSDIDILVVVGEELPKKPTERIDLVVPCIATVGAPIEPLIITREEFEKLKEKRNPAVVEALSNGIPILGQ
ncbi:MAG: nucleotidyltransferase domain-containing protein [Ignisphaera sp.]